MKSNDPEETLFQSGTVYVTRTRAVLGPTTYPIANITSVTPVTLPKSVARAVIGFGGLVLLLLGGGMSLVGIMGGEFSILSLFCGLTALAGLGATVLGIWHYRNSKETYALRIATASGEVDAVTSDDLAKVRAVADAISQAISGGRL